MPAGLSLEEGWIPQTNHQASVPQGASSARRRAGSVALRGRHSVERQVDRLAPLLDLLDQGRLLHVSVLLGDRFLFGRRLLRRRFLGRRVLIPRRYPFTGSM